MPRVSVVIPTFNCARFLTRAIRSALAQTYTDYEVIVVDDGSTDQTRDVVAQAGDRVKYLYQPNRGVSAARNLALSHASGEFIAYLDADDMWYPHKLEKQVAFMNGDKECGIVHSDVTIVDETDQIIHHRFNQETGRDVPRGYCAMHVLQRCHIQTPTVLERRECVEKTGRFDERLKVLEDGLRWILVTMEGMAIGYIDEPLAMYRWRSGSLSSSQRRMWEGTVRVFEILLEEKSLAARLGQQAAGIVRERLYKLQRDLAYLDRAEGHTHDARRRLVGLMRDWPWQSELHVELLKACVPAGLATRLRSLRERWTETGGMSAVPDGEAADVTTPARRISEPRSAER